MYDHLIQEILDNLYDIREEYIYSYENTKNKTDRALVDMVNKIIKLVNSYKD